MQKKNVSKIIYVLFISIIVFAWLDVTLRFFPIPAAQHLPESQICITENCFTVQLATTEKEREIGLMFVRQLDKNNGMLFVFQKEGVYPFWMKNTFIPLDIIWINNNKVVNIAHSVQPCLSGSCPSFNPEVEANAVVELNAGVTNALNISVGDEVALHLNK